MIAIEFRPPKWWPAVAVQCFDDLVAYRLVGASSCADAIVESLVEIGAACEGRAEGVAELSAAGAAFQRLKPDTALYTNVIDIVLGADATPAVVAGRAVGLSGYRTDARRKVASATTEYLRDASTILVHDYSSAVLAALQQLASSGQSRRVVVTECGFLGQGPRTASLVQSMGHRVAYSSDCSVGRWVAEVDVFVTGVEAFFVDGSMANTVGTYAIGLLCREAGVPVLAPAELLKLDHSAPTARRSSLRARLLHPWPSRGDVDVQQCEVDDHVLDAVPARLVTAYATESGLLPPAAIGAEAQRAIDSLMSVDIDGSRSRRKGV
ncbi:hypothetical protein ACFQ9V_20080 [Leifsonia sp. NPDC056665]|uniref:hypothetical protein n=1 Tax=Leifsonia sp. NPDC056665 TaxID=3345901 RepID=UPI0036BE3CB8